MHGQTGMVYRRSGDDIRGFGDLPHLARKIVRGLRRREADIARATNILPVRDRRGKLARECPIEFLRRLVKDKAETDASSPSLPMSLEQLNGWIPDFFRSLQNPSNRRVAHVRAAIQNTINSRRPDTGGSR